MEYRRFGKTEKQISVITLGGMRYAHGWDEPREELPEDSVRNCYEVTKAALEAGINHIESAWGYMKSEHLYGKVLPQLDFKRSDYFFMTKGYADTAGEMKEKVELQLKHLQMDYVDFYGYHGINTPEILEKAVQKGGAIDGLLQLKQEGIIKDIGFSTHGPLDVILDAIDTDLFDFINLHYYYFFQRNYAAVELAKKKDMGVFIISPNDKGGQLWNMPEKLKRACGPLNAVQFNTRFCLSEPAVTTLSFGIQEPWQVDQAVSCLNDGVYLSHEDQQIKERLDGMQKDLAGDYCTYCSECLPCPEVINIPEILRFRTMAVGYDMVDFGRYRYNMLDKFGHWFPGNFGNACTDCGECLPRCPEKLEIPKLLKETHSLLYVEKTEQKS